MKVTPILKEMKDTETTFSAYFPQGKWVDLNKPSNVIIGGNNTDLSATQESVHVHVKEGSLFAF